MSTINRETRRLGHLNKLIPQLWFNATQVAIRDSVAYLVSEARLSEVHELSTGEES